MRVAEQAGYAGAMYRLNRSLALLELSCGDPLASWRRSTAFRGARGDGRLSRPSGGLGRHRGADRRSATSHGRQAASIARRLHGSEADTAVRSTCDRCHGLLLAAQGDYEAAIVALDTAAAEPVPPQRVDPFELARTLLALGTVQRTARHKRTARESLQRAAGSSSSSAHASGWRRRARSCGADRWASRLEGELSETERRIVELVVAGRRNREVADELSLSPNTVSWNLSKVYRKLGVTSRIELAARVAATPPA